MRNSITEALDSVEDSSGPDFKVVLAGLSNVYTHYIATFEEYQRQRYEAASTIFGPHSLQAYQQQYAKLADTMLRVSGSVVQALFLCAPFLSKKENGHVFSSSLPTP